MHACLGRSGVDGNAGTQHDHDLSRLRMALGGGHLKTCARRERGLPYSTPLSTLLIGRSYALRRP